MGEKIVVGPINKGLRNDRTAFVIDNDSFPTLINAYQWRGRLKRKRGTEFICRLSRFFNSTSLSYNPGMTSITLTNDGMGNGIGNILTGFTTLEATATLEPGSISITDTTSGQVYTDPLSNGVLTGSGGGTGTVNYATGAILITGAAGDIITATFIYYPGLPVMGIEDFTILNSQFPGNILFDTKYSYNLLATVPYNDYDVSFYKNPPTSTYMGYVHKTVVTAVKWNGNDYQQFYTLNYQGALWATNGTAFPFNPTLLGMQYKPIVTVTVTTGGPPAIVSLNIVAHGLSVGDFLFINEVVTTTGINFQTGYVTTVTDANNVVVEFPNATIATNGTGGIAQYLTNRSDITKDCIRWYDGDPTNGSATAPVLNGNLGWVNFMPPISESNFSIGDLPPAQYYLIGAKLMISFKDRIIFFGPVVQTSKLGSQVYLQDTIVYSQNGTPYYTASFTGDPTLASTVFNPILVPVNQTASAAAYFSDVTGFGGFISAGVDEQIVSASPNEDVIIVGFTKSQTRLVYSGNDIVPFNFFLTNVEYGTDSTFSIINMDKGVISKGLRGFIMANQVEASRIDLEIPDEVFQTRLLNNGNERVCAQRDYINEWIYFTYPVSSINYSFPTQTLQYNYRDNSWAIFRESYTTYGAFRPQTGYTWGTIGLKYPTWGEWNDPWGAGVTTLLQPQVLGGNQQGFVLMRAVGTAEGTSLYIQNIVGSTITAPNHCLNVGDYIVISGALGTVGPAVNGLIFSVNLVIDVNTFTLNPPLSSGFTYTGGGLITRMYVPFIQSKQFPLSWEMARKTRLGNQMYLLSFTELGQITLLIFLSEDANNAYNDLSYPLSSGIVPELSDNNTLLYSTTLYTCPESTNLGLTPANVNLQMPTAQSQQQIWHRMNTSLLEDTVQVGFTMNDTQMRDVNFDNQFAEIEIHGFILDCSPSQLLA